MTRGLIKMVRKYFSDDEINMLKKILRGGTKQFYRNFKSNQVYFCDMAPTSRSKCFRCGEVILKDTPRIFYKESVKLLNKNSTIQRLQLYPVQIARKFCHSCAPLILQLVYESHYNNIIDTRKIIKKFKRAMKGKNVIRIIKNNQIIEGLSEEKK